MFDKKVMKQKFVKNSLETNLAKVWQIKSFTEKIQKQFCQKVWQKKFKSFQSKVW
jgi:hypothetical protein